MTVRAAYINELREIAQQCDLQVFHALDKLANAQTSAGYVRAPGSANMGGTSAAPPPGAQAAGGITDMPGMSIHCDTCNAELKKECKACPKCGTKLKKKFDMKAIDRKLDSSVAAEKQQPESERLDTGDTGGEVAENEELAAITNMDTGKYAGIFKKPPTPLIKKLPRGAQDPVAAGVLLTSLYGGNEVRKILSNADKTASARLGNPVMRIRRKSWKGMTPSKALERINQSTKKFTKGHLAR